MSMYCIDEYQSGDELKILKLMKQSFPGFGRPQSHWKWKFGDNILNKFSINVARTKSGEIVGQYALIPTELVAFSKIIQGAQSVDTATSPDYRGQKIFVNLASQLFSRVESDGCEILFGFPNENSYPGFVKKLGWKHIGNYNLMIHPINIAPIVEKRYPTLNKIARTMGFWKIIKLVQKLFIKFVMATDDRYRVKPLNEFDDKFDEFLINDNSSVNKISLKKDRVYFNWRYIDSPSVKYNIFGAFDEKDKLQGYIVLSFNKKSGSIVDWRANDLNIEKCLLNYAVKKFYQWNVPYIKTWSAKHLKSYNIFRVMGFLNLKKIPVIVKNLAAVESRAYDLKNWIIRPGDCDTF